MVKGYKLCSSYLGNVKFYIFLETYHELLFYTSMCVVYGSRCSTTMNLGRYDYSSMCDQQCIEKLVEGLDCVRNID